MMSRPFLCNLLGRRALVIRAPSSSQEVDMNTVFSSFLIGSTFGFAVVLGPAQAMPARPSTFELESDVTLAQYGPTARQQYYLNRRQYYYNRRNYYNDRRAYYNQRRQYYY